MSIFKLFTTQAFFYSVLSILLLGCNDDHCDFIVPEEPATELLSPDGEALEAKYGEYLDKTTQVFAIDAEAGGTIKGEKGTEITINGGSIIDINGEPVAGPIQIELIEIFERANMLLSDKPTQGRQQDGSIATLISGGELFVNASRDGERLFLAADKGFFFKVDTETMDTDMKIFKNENEDCLEADCDVVWIEDENGRLQVGDGGGVDGSTFAFYGFARNFGWTNIDKFYNDPRPKTNLFVDVPVGFDQTNCMLYITYDGQPTLLARLDVYNDQTELFTEHYGLIPIGLEVHFIMVSVVDGQYYYAIQGATIVEDHLEVMKDLAPTTEAELIQMIEELP